MPTESEGIGLDSLAESEPVPICCRSSAGTNAPPNSEISMNNAQVIGWPQAVGTLAEAKTRAETCVTLLKTNGSKQQISSGQMLYGETKSKFDGIISELVVALSEGGSPKSLPSLENDLQQGGVRLEQFAQIVDELLPHFGSGERDILSDIAKATIKPLIDAVSKGIAALYNNHRKDKALTRETIKTQLTATKWLDFNKIKGSN
jgi:hypothetical protein